MGAEPRRRCPSCGGPDVRHSQRRGILDSIMTMLRKTPFRCRGCGRRFYRQESPTHQASMDEGREA